MLPPELLFKSFISKKEEHAMEVPNKNTEDWRIKNDMPATDFYTEWEMEKSRKRAGSILSQSSTKSRQRKPTKKRMLDLLTGTSGFGNLNRVLKLGSATRRISVFHQKSPWPGQESLFTKPFQSASCLFRCLLCRHSYAIRDATLVPVGNQATLVHIPPAASGAYISSFPIASLDPMPRRTYRALPKCHLACH